MQKTAIWIILAIAIVVGVVFFFRQAPPAGGLTLYYGQECPHCANVEEFIKNNKIDDKVEIKRVEVYHNQSNANEMAKNAQKCGIPGNQLGVPMLWDGKKCYTGELDITNYFQPYVNK